MAGWRETGSLQCLRVGLRSLVWRHIHLALGWALVVGSERCCDPM